MRLKYSNARRSSWATPSPSAYIRPSFHCAIGWPPSAAYCSAFSELGVGPPHVKSSDIGVDLDDVTILQQGDRAADGRLRPVMADTEAAGGARKPAVGDQGDLAAHPLPGQRRRGREYLPHAGAA